MPGNHWPSWPCSKRISAFAFWRRKVVGHSKPDAVGKLTFTGDLTEDVVLVAMTVQAIAVIGADGKTPRITKSKPPLGIADDMRAALDAVPAAVAAFAGFPRGAQRDCTEWIMEAKQRVIRAHRRSTTVEQSAEGRRRYWQVMGR